MKQIISALIAMLIIGACDSNVNNSPSNADLNFQSGGTPFTFVAPGTHVNDANPYDYVGMLHNDYCAFACNRILELTDDLDSNQVFPAMRNALADLAELKGLSRQESIEFLEEQQYSYSNYYVEDAAAWMAELSGPPFTERELQYINQIGTLIGSGITSPTVFADSIDALESRILAVDWNIAGEETTALIAIAICKHSFHFWTGVNTQVISYGGDPADWNNETTLKALPYDIRQAIKQVQVDDRTVLVSYFIQESASWSIRKFWASKWHDLKSSLFAD